MYSRPQKLVTHYTILGVEENATSKEIRNAYYQKARETHSDITKNKEKIEQFYSIKEAYDILADDNERKRYDETLNNQRKNEVFLPKNELAASNAYNRHVSPTAKFIASAVKSSNPDLPYEIQLQIFCYLSFHDLLTISLLAKQFNDSSFWKFVFKYFHPDLFHIINHPLYRGDINYKNKFAMEEFRATFLKLYPHLSAHVSIKKIAEMTKDQRKIMEKLINYINEIGHYLGKPNFFYQTYFSSSFSYRLNTTKLKDAAITLKYVALHQLPEENLHPYLDTIKNSSPLLYYYKELVGVQLLTGKVNENTSQAAKSSMRFNY